MRQELVEDDKQFLSILACSASQRFSAKKAGGCTNLADTKLTGFAVSNPALTADHFLPSPPPGESIGNRDRHTPGDSTEPAGALSVICDSTPSN